MRRDCSFSTNSLLCGVEKKVACGWQINDLVMYEWIKHSPKIHDDNQTSHALSVCLCDQYITTIYLSRSRDVLIIFIELWDWITRLVSSCFWFWTLPYLNRNFTGVALENYFADNLYWLKKMLYICIWQRTIESSTSFKWEHACSYRSLMILDDIGLPWVAWVTYVLVHLKPDFYRYISTIVGNNLVGSTLYTCYKQKIVVEYRSQH